MFDYLDRLRERPKLARQRYAFGGAILVTLLIGGVWGLTLPTRFVETAAVVQANEAQEVPPFAALWAGLKNQFAALPMQPEAATTTEAVVAVDELVMPVTTTTAPATVPIMIGTTSASGT